MEPKNDAIADEFPFWMGVIFRFQPLVFGGPYQAMPFEIKKGWIGKCFGLVDLGFGAFLCSFKMRGLVIAYITIEGAITCKLQSRKDDECKIRGLVVRYSTLCLAILVLELTEDKIHEKIQPEDPEACEQEGLEQCLCAHLTARCSSLNETLWYLFLVTLDECQWVRAASLFLWCLRCLTFSVLPQCWWIV